MGEANAGWLRTRRFRHSAATDRAPWLGERPAPRRVPKRTRSLYLTMRDGVRIAIDMHLPARAGAPLPAIVRQTRYFRGVAFREPFARLPVEFLLDHASHTRDRFVAAGYAWIDVCARGSGASFGHRPAPWSPDEVADGAEVVEWIVRQPWCDGRVGATGVSYDGTAADFLLVNQHPAVRAIAPRFSLWDVFADVAFPGGIHLAWFTEMWCTFNRALDAGRLDVAFALMLREQLRGIRELESAAPPLASLLAISERQEMLWLSERLLRSMALGVRPVDDDPGRELLAQAVAAHADNFDIHGAALLVDHRDDTGLSPEYPEDGIDRFSPHAHALRIAGSGAAILSMSGWLDGAYQHSAIKRFHAVSTPGSQLLLGPWEHGGLQNTSPYSPSHKSAFDQDGALLRFFDHHLKGIDNGAGGDPPVRYFTIGEERWKAAERWPPPEAEAARWYLAGERRLVAGRPPGPDRADAYAIDHEVGTGARSRFNALLGMLPPIGYGDRARVGSRLLVYRSDPLEAPLVVTGHPLVRLWLSLDGSDAAVFAYLEDERPDGRVDLVTEGQLRVLHRRWTKIEAGVPARSFARADAAPVTPGEVAELVFDLLPISWRFAAGHRLRLAIAGADRDHFERIDGARSLQLRHGPSRPSHLELPVVKPRA